MREHRFGGDANAMFIRHSFADAIKATRCALRRAPTDQHAEWCKGRITGLRWGVAFANVGNVPKPLEIL